MTSSPVTVTSASGDEPTIEYCAAGGVLEAEDVHVRARVGVAQHPVDVQRRRPALHLEAAGDDHLEDFAVHDRLLAAVEGGEVLGLVPALLDAGGKIEGRRLQHGHRLEHRGADACQQFLHPGDGVMPGLVHALGAVVEVDGVGDQQHSAVHVVVDSHVGDEVQGQLRKLQVILGRAGQLFPVADRLPAQEAHQPGGERRKPVEPVGAQRLDGVADGINGVSVHGHPGRRLAQPVRLPVLGGQRGAGPGTNEGVAGPGTANSRRLHEERARLALRQFPVQPDRRFGIRQHLQPDRDDAAVGGEFPEFFEARADDSEVLHRYWFSVCSW